MKKIITLIAAIAVTITLLPVTSYADSSKIVTLGENLTDSEKEMVLDTFGVKDANDVTIITINNQMERELLLNYIPESAIGNKTISCSFIQPQSEGGLVIKTANLTYVTEDILANALMTAGIENCRLEVTAPYPVSGTGALTGVYKAYESLGIDLSEDKKEIATEELIVTSDLVKKYGSDITVIIKEAKDEIIGQAGEMSDEELKEVIKKICDKYNISLSEDEINSIVSILKKIASLDYDIDAFKTTVSTALDKINDLSEKGKAAGGFFIRLIEVISNFFRNLFGK